MTELSVTLRIKYEIGIGEVNLNEIVYVLQENQSLFMRELLTAILRKYDDDVCELLCGRHLSSERKGLGRHGTTEDHGRRFICRGRCARRRGYRREARHIMTVFGQVALPIRVVECRKCGTRYSPILDALSIEPYSQRESNFEHAVIEAVIDTNYRRLIDGRSIDISLGGIHNIVAGSDVPRDTEEHIVSSTLRGIMADGTGLKQYKGTKGELRAVVGIDQDGSIVPLGTFVNTSWSQIERSVRSRLSVSKEGHQGHIPFVYDGEPGLDQFLAEVAESQRCTWHASRGVHHALWEDGLKKKERNPYVLQVKELVGIELPAGDYELLKDEDKDSIAAQLKESKSSMEGLIKIFRERGYENAVVYLENLSRQVFTNVNLWLQTGIIAPKTISRLERLFRELGRRLKRIAWGWSDKVATNLSKMIVVRQYQREKWEAFWKKKLGILGNFTINLLGVEITPCHNF